MNASGQAHPKRRKKVCPSKHELTVQNTRITKEQRWSKRKAMFITYYARQCRTCWRECKRLAMARKRKATTT